MSAPGDEPPPPPPPNLAPGDEPPPPPPPPNLAPPPGYAAYEPGPSAAGPLRRVGGLRTATLILLGVYALGTVIQLIGTPGIVDSAEKYQDGSITEDAFKDDYMAYNLSGLLTLVAQIALIVVTMIWLYRIAKNHQALGRRTTWGPGWAIGGWFLPPILYVIPTLMLRESWKASNPDVPPGDDRWKSTPDNPLLWVWVVLYIVAPLVLNITGLRQQFGMMSSKTDDLADSLDGRLASLILLSVALLLATVVWGLFVRALSGRHAQLTGEAAR